MVYHNAEVYTAQDSRTQELGTVCAVQLVPRYYSCDQSSTTLKGVTEISVSSYNPIYYNTINELLDRCSLNCD